MLASVLHSALKEFPSISLEEMDSVELMSRFDTKYVFSADRLPYFFSLLNGNYRILEIAGDRAFPYSTLYLDTPDYMFYRQHVTGKLARHKVRYRTYLASGITYLEVKEKNNKLRTLKWRLLNNSDPGAMDQAAIDFLSEHFPGDRLSLWPVLRNGFMRSTLVGISTHERITIDFNMDFAATDGTKFMMPYMTVVELKSECYTCHSPFRNAIRQAGVRPAGFSKYCTGNAILLDLPRKNILKEKILLLNKIEHEYNESVAG